MGTEQEPLVLLLHRFLSSLAFYVNLSASMCKSDQPRVERLDCQLARLLRRRSCTSEARVMTVCCRNGPIKQKKDLSQAACQHRQQGENTA
eukprot:IDg19138t1